MLDAKRELIDFLQKANWEGGWGEVIYGWPSMVPQELKEFADIFDNAREVFEQNLGAYCHKLGVENNGMWEGQYDLD